VGQVKNQPVLKFLKNSQPNSPRTCGEPGWLVSSNPFWQLYPQWISVDIKKYAATCITDTHMNMGTGTGEYLSND